MTRPTGPTTDGGKPGPATSEGIRIERLDLTVRRAVTYLFPKERGIDLLALLFLHAAEVQPLEIDGHGQVEVVIIRLQSIEAFARQHEWGKDTALRYIAVLEALQILRRYRHADYTELHIPLVIWSPSQEALSELDRLLEADTARDKLQQLANGVRARFLLLYGSPHSWSSLFDDLTDTLTDVQEVLNHRPSRTKRQLLQLRVENLKMRLKAHAEKGDFQVLQRNQNEQRDTEKGDFRSGVQDQNEYNSVEKGDFHSHSGGHYIPGHAQKGDFRDFPILASGQLPAQKGDFQTGSGNQNRSNRAQKGDFCTGPASQNNSSNAEKGDFQGDPASPHTEKGDFQGQSGIEVAQKGDFQGSGSGASLNDNVITPNNDILGKDDVIDNDATAAAEKQQGYSPREASKVGRKLASFLENSPENTGGFVKKCKSCSPTVIQAAVIDVLVHNAFPTIDPTDDRGRPRNKASWFHGACNDFSKPGSRIPPWVEKWLKTDIYWQDLDVHWKDVAEQLQEAERRYKRYMITDTGTADLVRQWLRGEIEQQALDEALQLVPAEALPVGQASSVGLQQPGSRTSVANGKPSVSSEGNPAAAKTWMDEYEAEALVEEIMNDERATALGVSKAVAKQEHGVFVVMVTCRGARDMAATFSMKTAQAWRTHLEKVQKSMAQQQQQLRERGEQHGTYQ